MALGASTSRTSGYGYRMAKPCPVDRPVSTLRLSAAAVEVGIHQHYMKKAMFVHREVLADTPGALGGSTSTQPGIFGPERAVLADVELSLILAGGTRSHFGNTARYWLEAIANVPCSAGIASECRHRTSLGKPKHLIVTISRPGETAGTVAALGHAKSVGRRETPAICNVPEWAIVSECGLRFSTRAGPEIGVISCKPFTTQLAALSLRTRIMVKLQQERGPARAGAGPDQLRYLPVAVNSVLGFALGIEIWAQGLAAKRHALFPGGGRQCPIAVQGGLTRKEVPCIHAEACPADVLTHGPIALVNSDLPVSSMPSPMRMPRSPLRKACISSVDRHYGELSPILPVIPGATSVVPCNSGKGDQCGQAKKSR